MIKDPKQEIKELEQWIQEHKDNRTEEWWNKRSRLFKLKSIWL